MTKDGGVSAAALLDRRGSRSSRALRLLAVLAVVATTVAIVGVRLPGKAAADTPFTFVNEQFNEANFPPTNWQAAEGTWSASCQVVTAPATGCAAVATVTDGTVGLSQLLFNPSVNAYRRLQPGNFTPATASWGTDNRTAAIRAITGSPKGARLEHRRPGADVSPHLAIAAMLAGGLHGIAGQLDPPAPATADAYADGRFPRLPGTLAGAIAALRDSPVAPGLLGREFVAHYLLSREVELRLWREWESEQVTEWEHRRYFETS